MGIIVVPFTLIDWNRVKDAFSSKDSASLAIALEILTGWRIKMASWHSSAAEASEALIRARLNETVVDDTLPSWWRQENSRLLYSMAITRFVNFLDEVAKATDSPTLNSKSNSMERNLQKFQVPSWVVQIRHDVVHKKMPSLEILRRTGEFAFKWLTENFWNLPVEQAVGLGPPQKKTIQNSMDKVHNHLLRFETIRASMLRKEFEGRELTILDRKIMKECLGHLQKVCMIKKNLFLSVLSAEGHMILNESQLNSSGWDVQHVINHQAVIPPGPIQELWRPLLNQLNTLRALPDLLVLLLQRASLPSTSPSAKTQLLGWSHLMINAFTDLPENEQDDTFDWKLVLRQMMMEPTFHSRESILKVMNAVQRPFRLTDENRRKLLCLYDLYVGSLDGGHKILTPASSANSLQHSAGGTSERSNYIAGQSGSKLGQKAKRQKRRLMKQQQLEQEFKESNSENQGTCSSEPSKELCKLNFDGLVTRDNLGALLDKSRKLREEMGGVINGGGECEEGEIQVIQPKRRWQLEEDPIWEVTPIGLIPGQTPNSLSLILLPSQPTTSAKPSTSSFPMPPTAYTSAHGVVQLGETEGNVNGSRPSALQRELSSSYSSAAEPKRSKASSISTGESKSCKIAHPETLHLPLSSSSVGIIEPVSKRRPLVAPDDEKIRSEGELSSDSAEV